MLSSSAQSCPRVCYRLFLYGREVTRGSGTGGSGLVRLEQANGNEPRCHRGAGCVDPDRGDLRLQVPPEGWWFFSFVFVFFPDNTINHSLTQDCCTTWHYITHRQLLHRRTRECTGSGKYRRTHIQRKAFLVLTHHHLWISASIHRISQHKPRISSRKHDSIHEHIHPASIKSMNHPLINLFIYLYSHSVDTSKISESIHPVKCHKSHMRIHPSVCLSVHPSIHSSKNHFKINESIHPVIHPPINPSLIDSYIWIIPKSISLSSHLSVQRPWSTIYSSSIQPYQVIHKSIHLKIIHPSI